jgi:hypothetical protein
MAQTEPPHPDAPEFAPIRSQLAVLYIEHKADMAMGDWLDAEIVRRTSEITAALIVLSRMPRANDDTARLLRHRWFFAACGRLFDDQRAVPLDG